MFVFLISYMFTIYDLIFFEIDWNDDDWGQD